MLWVSKLQARSNQQPVFFLSFFPALWAKNGFYSFKGLFRKQKRIYSRDVCASLILRCLLPGPLHKRADLWWYMLTYAHLYVEWLWEDTQNTVAAVAAVGSGGFILLLFFTLLSSLNFFTMCLYYIFIDICVLSSKNSCRPEERAVRSS